MKVIILAAGMGSRLSKYTEDSPKCLLEIGEISILERQVRTFRRLGIDDIIIVKGFAAEKIDIEGVRYYVDEKHCYDMVYSLFCAEPEIQGDVIISYADILFEDSVLRSLLQAPRYDIAVVVDTLWEEYYRKRFEEPFERAESLIYDANDCILEIGKRQPSPEDVQAQYVGLVKLSEEGSRIFRQTYRHAKAMYWDRPWQRGRLFQKTQMTDFLQALIDDGVCVHAVPIQHGWLEFDTVTDYEQVLEWYADGAIERFCLLNS